MGIMVNLDKSGVCKTLASGYVGATPAIPTNFNMDHWLIGLGG